MSRQNNPTGEPAGPSFWVTYNLDLLGRDPGELHWMERFRMKCWWSALQLVLLLARHGHFIRNEPFLEPTPSQRFLIPLFARLIILLPILVIVFVVLWPLLLGWAWNEIAGWVHTDVGFWASVLVLCAFGYLLYWLRRWFRLFYGFSETLFGFWLVWYGLSEMKKPVNPDQVADNFKVLAAIIAGFYVIVRGSDNFHGGWEAAGAVMRAWLRQPQRKIVAVANPESSNKSSG